MTYTDNNEFTVVFECPLSEAQNLSSGQLPRRDMPIVWRGDNPLAQRMYAA